MLLTPTASSTRFPILLALGLSFLTVQAATEVKVDETVDFSRYETFIVVEGTPPRSERASREIADAVASAVAKRGLRPVDQGADLLVRTHVLVDAHTLEELADPVQWEFLTGIRSISAYELGEGTLVIDFIDMDTQATVWRGVTTEHLSGAAEKTYKRIPKYVRRLIDKYPVP